MKTLELTDAKLVSYDNKWLVCFSNKTDSIIGRIASSAQCRYTLTNFRDGRICNVTYHITKGGNTIIDGITEVK